MTAATDSLLEAARAGDESAFRALVEPLEGKLTAHCRRMLGSSHDAEDAMQEVLVSAWRALPRFEGRGSLQGWLFRIATNKCLTALRRRRGEPTGVLGQERVRALPGGAGEYDLLPADAVAGGGDSPEESYERREDVERALIAALRHLTPGQRATLVLRDALDFSAGETAALLGTTPASVNSALQRARENIEDRASGEGQASLQVLGDEHLRELVERCVRAIDAADARSVAALLSRA